MIVVLGGHGTSTRIVINYLAHEFDVTAIIERPISTWQLLRRCAKNLGISTVFGQAPFIIFRAFKLGYAENACRILSASTAWTHQYLSML